MQDLIKERFDVELEEGEFYHFKKTIEESWINRAFELESVIVKHIINSLEQFDYKPKLENDRLVFRKK